MKPIYITLVVAAFCVACNPLANPSHGKITFSTDTLFFDTVFTSLGSATLELRAINGSDRPLLIDKIWLAGGDNSPFRLNINGNPDGEVSNVTLAAGDSIFIFADVKIDPLGAELPVSVVDSIMFQSGNDLSRVFLQAWGQDIILLKNEVVGDASWSGKRPYVIYGDVFIDTAKTLTVLEGTRIYFHNDASMTVAGNIILAGSKELPVLLASDMTYDEYEDVPGQWKGITFQSCSRSNKITDAVIRNADIALNLKGDPATGSPDLEMLNVWVMHCSVSSLSAVNSYIKACNCLFAHTGFSTVNIVSGGEAEFIQCSLANRWEYSFRSAPVFYIGKGNGTELPEVTMSNSIIAGDRPAELEIEGQPADLNTRIAFDTCFIKIDTIHTLWWNHSSFKGIITGDKPGFISWTEYDFRPDTLSLLLDVAGKVKASLYPEDIRHKPRPVFQGPDIGAFERQAGEKSN